MNPSAPWEARKNISSGRLPREPCVVFGCVAVKLIPHPRQFFATFRVILVNAELAAKHHWERPQRDWERGRFLQVDLSQRFDLQAEENLVST